MLDSAFQFFYSFESVVNMRIDLYELEQRIKRCGALKITLSVNCVLMQLCTLLSSKATHPA